MRAASGPAGPPLRQQCEVCKAAVEFVKARDALVNSGMDTVGNTGHDSQHPIIKRVQQARAAWDYARGMRHTGAPHAPKVA